MKESMQGYFDYLTFTAQGFTGLQNMSQERLHDLVFNLAQDFFPRQVMPQGCDYDDIFDVVNSTFLDFFESVLQCEGPQTPKRKRTASCVDESQHPAKK